MLHAGATVSQMGLRVPSVTCPQRWCATTSAAGTETAGSASASAMQATGGMTALTETLLPSQALQVEPLR